MTSGYDDTVWVVLERRRAPRTVTCPRVHQEPIAAYESKDEAKRAARARSGLHDVQCIGLHSQDSD